MPSLRIREGELTIDHRNSPGVDPGVLAAARASGKEFISVKEGGLFESATVTCVHCNVIVVLNPNRSRPRNYCRRCDQYICDGCAALPTDGTCIPFEKILMDAQDSAYHAHGE